MGTHQVQSLYHNSNETWGLLLKLLCDLGVLVIPEDVALAEMRGEQGEVKAAPPEPITERFSKS